MLWHVGILTEASGRQGVRVRFWRLEQNPSIFASHAALLLFTYLLTDVTQNHYTNQIDMYPHSWLRLSQQPCGRLQVVFKWFAGLTAAVSS